MTEPDGAEILADHLANCTKPDAVVVVDGSGDSLVDSLLADGWTLGDTEYVAGKRIRSMRPPKS